MRYPLNREPIPLPPRYKRFVLLMGASKGGTGKSTLAVNLGVTASLGGLKTIIFDTDVDGDTGQESCMRWAKNRSPGDLVVRRASLARIGEAIRWAEQNGFDLIIIDTAGRDMAGMKHALDLADFMLTPSQPSPLDLQATAPIRRLWSVSQTPASIALTQVIRETLPRTRYYVDRYAEQGAVLPAFVGRRVQYLDAMEQGLGVSEYLPGDVGDKEMRRLLAAIFAEVQKRQVA
ncbi:CobQ/CobB/MinD/ParA nucleotide binding domain protein [Devosia equisanguinis]|uniref:CobQ/CobB/MinD/ParA nucleotide binding domain protein n=1 Tax=Devosia equisanguinis TaxID=2490941 RepID=A0A3S4EJY7_9HYPH|nr:ParA family protein [Devosia equisanguinis]VDS03614.1 CobQ/CobB/MinD/ParA nucleotide binding domain protein [Devosia equisanguinis]